MQNAVSACSRDPRFPPVTVAELDGLEYSVDVLGQPEPISSPAELDVKKYGVIVSCGGRRGLLPLIAAANIDLKGFTPVALIRLQRFLGLLYKA